MGFSPWSSSWMMATTATPLPHRESGGLDPRPAPDRAVEGDFRDDRSVASIPRMSAPPPVGATAAAADVAIVISSSPLSLLPLSLLPMARIVQIVELFQRQAALDRTSTRIRSRWRRPRRSSRSPPSHQSSSSALDSGSTSGARRVNADWYERAIRRHASLRLLDVFLLLVRVSPPPSSSECSCSATGTPAAAPSPPPSPAARAVGVLVAVPVAGAGACLMVGDEGGETGGGIRKWTAPISALQY